MRQLEEELKRVCVLCNSDTGHDREGLPRRCTYLLGGVGEVRSAQALAWFGLGWCVGQRLGATDFRRSGAVTRATHVLLGLGAIVSGIRFDSFMCTCRMVASQVLELIGLGVGDIGCILDLVVNELLIGHVDQWTHVDA